MNLERLQEIILKTTTEYRYGDEVVEKDNGPIRVMEINMMPHVNDGTDGDEVVDLWFIAVGVNKAVAEEYRGEIVAILTEWPTEYPLTGGLSYITFGGVLGSQDIALSFIALGKVLGFWETITPATMGLAKGSPKGEELAGSGFIYAAGYRPERIAA